MKERPILMRGPLVVATLADRKWQTRRVIKPQPTEQLYQIGATDEWAPPDPRDQDAPDFRRAVRCPYGTDGDRLWVRETFARLWFNAEDGWQTAYRADDNLDCIRDAAAGNWKPSIHMPRWASRLTLENTSVRVERLQDISDADILAEGFPEDPPSFAEGFASYWNSTTTNPAYRWEANPWVWVISYRRIPGAAPNS